MAKGLIIAPGLDNFMSEFSIREIKPDCIAFITTEATMPFVGEIIKNSGIKAYKAFFVKNIFSTVETIDEFINALSWLTKDKKIQDIWIDATNCITVIEMATYTSASLIDLFKDVLGGNLEFHLVYIHADYEIKPDGVAGEVRGTERLIELEKPLDSLSFVLALDAIRAFNQQRYEQVKENFLLLSRNTTGEKSILYQGLAFIAGGYEQWDKMDADTAIKNLEEAEHYLGKVREFKGVSEVMQKIQANIYALRKVKESNEESIILNLYSNALRRIRERKFDDALARLYSALERITQHQLEKYRIETSNPDYSNLPPEIVAKFKESLGFLPTELELKKNAILLILLGNPIGKEIEKIGYRKFLGLIGIRNSSILAHGIKPVSEANFTDFKEKLIEPVMKKFIEVNNISSDEIQKHSHIRGSEITEFLHKERIFPRV